MFVEAHSMIVRACNGELTLYHYIEGGQPPICAFSNSD